MLKKLLIVAASTSLLLGAAVGSNAFHAPAPTNTEPFGITPDCVYITAPNCIPDTVCINVLGGNCCQNPPRNIMGLPFCSSLGVVWIDANGDGCACF